MHETKHALTANGISLPIGVRNQRYAVLRETSVKRTSAEAQALAEKQLVQREIEELGEVEVVSRTLHGHVEGGHYILTAVYTCHESIGIEEPLRIEIEEPA